MRFLASAAVGLGLVVSSPFALAQQVPAPPSTQLSIAAVLGRQNPLAGLFYRDSVRVSRAAHHLVGFETGADASRETAAYYADAATAASDALMNVAGRPGSDAVLAPITDVVITKGDAPSASLARGKLIVTIAPAKGVAGRLSADQIERVIQPPWSIRSPS